jgi:hypothetical protein
MPDNNQISMSMNIAYSGQTRAKLEADLTPLVKELVMEDIESSAQLFEKKAGHHVYSHAFIASTLSGYLAATSSNCVQSVFRS